MSQDIFDTYIDNAFDEARQATFKFKQFEINYKSFFPKNKSAACLDIGVGRGEMLSCMRSWGFAHSKGVDISPSTIEFCKSLDLDCELTKDTVSWLDENQDSFDLITLLDVLEHVPRDQTIEFCRKLRGSLKEGGTLIVQVPNLQAPDGHLHHFNDFTHVSGFIEHSLSQVLSTAGFKDITFYGFEEFYESSPKVWVKKLLRFFYLKVVRLTRAVNGNINPSILTPVLFAVVKR